VPALLNVDQWTALCVGRMSDLTPPGSITMAGLWSIAEALWMANSRRDPVEVADEWQRGSALPLRVWPGGS